MGVVLSLDAGTTGVRAVAVGEDSTVLATRYRELTQHFPRPGWVEHDPEEIWQASLGCLAGVLDDLGRTAGEPRAIGITNQRETVVVWDRRTGRPLHRAIVWQDRRTAADCAELAGAGHLPLVRSRTGLVLDPYFSASKLSWLFRHGGLQAGADVAFGTVDSWLVWNLTAGDLHATDPTNASRTLLFDIERLAWDGELLELFGLPRSILPEVVPSSGRVAVTAPGVVPGLRGRVPVSGLAGDQQAALFGQACFEPGMTKNTYGTGSFVLMNVGAGCPRPAQGLLTTVAWSLGSPGRVDYALEGSIFATGAAVQWLRDGLGLIGSSAEIGPLAQSVPDTGGAYLVPALAGLGSPWWDPYARGTMVGLSRGVGRPQLARAIVEAMAYQTRDVVDAMTAASGQGLAELRVDGGASVMDLLLRFQADLLGVAVVRSAFSEATAMGAAFLAGLAEGMWSSLEEIGGIWAEGARAEPSAEASRADLGYAGWRRATERARGWASPP